MNAGRCPACGTGSMAPWRTAVLAGEPRDGRTFELRRCAACGTAVTVGAAPREDAYETGQYAPVEPIGQRGVRAVQRLVSGQPARLLRRSGAQPGARVLDVGAGKGLLVAALLDAGFDATGCEPSRASSEAARASGFPVETVSLQDIEAEGLDAVVLWQVLEHLEDPLAALQRIASWLNPHGALLIGVPNLSSWQARLAGPDWFHLDLPRHRTHFTPGGLARMLARADFQIEMTSHLIFKHNPDGMWFAFLSRLGVRPGLPFHALHRNARLTPREAALIALGVPTIPLAVGAEGMSAVVQRGGTFATIARRRL